MPKFLNLPNSDKHTSHHNCNIHRIYQLGRKLENSLLRPNRFHIRLYLRKQLRIVPFFRFQNSHLRSCKNKSQDLKGNTSFKFCLVGRVISIKWMC